MSRKVQRRKPRTREEKRRWPLPTVRRGRGALFIGLMLLVALVAAGIIPKVHRSARAEDTAANAGSTLQGVYVVRARLEQGTAELELPGSMQAINIAEIYARTSGYVKVRSVDIGAQVKAGQVLAVIDAPEIDHELAQARATLEQARATLEQANANLAQARAQVGQSIAAVAAAKANQEIADTTNQRWTQLVNKGVLPRQQGDERRATFAARQAETEAALAAQKTAEANVGSRVADVAASQAAIDAQIANVHRLEDLQSFERVVAPFDGVVTERRIEKGDLISVGSAENGRLFSIAQGRVLRIQVSVPQFYAVDLKAGQQADVTVRERPGERFTGTVARTAQSISPDSRTLLTEVQVENPSGHLLPGMYAEVKFVLPRSKPVAVVPGSALVTDAAGTRLVVVSRDRRVHFVKVEQGRDLGAELEIVSGLAGDEDVVNNPPDNLAEGQQVMVVTASGASKKEKQ